MQTIIQVACNPKHSTSLRKSITTDSHLEDFGLIVMKNKQKGRSEGWAKISGKGLYGVLNIEWDASTKILSARVISKNTNKKQDIVGVFIDYLLNRHQKSIRSITIFP